MLSKIRHFVNEKTLKSIYYAIFSSHLTYGSLVWRQKKNPNLTKIISLQKIALRIISFSPFRSPTSSLFPDLSILKFPDLITINNCIFVYDHFNITLPFSISHLFNKTSDIHPYPTRNYDQSKLNIPRFNTLKYGKYSIVHQCILDWNSLLLTRQYFPTDSHNKVLPITDIPRNQFKKILSKRFFHPIKHNLYLFLNELSLLFLIIFYFLVTIIYYLFYYLYYYPITPSNFSFLIIIA